jgi:hypothetical protein
MENRDNQLNLNTLSVKLTALGPTPAKSQLVRPQPNSQSQPKLDKDPFPNQGQAAQDWPID